jgi:hypothetical protein
MDSYDYAAALSDVLPAIASKKARRRGCFWARALLLRNQNQPTKPAPEIATRRDAGPPMQTQTFRITNTLTPHEFPAQKQVPRKHETARKPYRKPPGKRPTLPP